MLLQLSQFVPFCPTLPSNPYSLKASPHHCSCPWVMRVSPSATSFSILYFTFHGNSVTTYLCLIPSSLHPFSHIPFPSGNHQNPLHIHDSVPVLLVCLVCFLHSIVDRHIFFAILLFIILILFFLNKSLYISYNNGLETVNSFSLFLVWEALYLPFNFK